MSTIIIGGVVFILMALALVRFVKTRAAGDCGCGHGCNGCVSSCGAQKTKK